MSDYAYGLCFVDDVEVEATSAGSVRVRIRGAWPTPAWRLDHEELELSGGKLKIKLVGKVKKGIVAPSVITPFEHVLEINLEAKNIMLEVLGRGGRVIRASVKT